MGELKRKCCGDCEFFFYWLASHRCAILGQKRWAGDLICDSLFPINKKAEEE